jgi:hypothetical protein
MVKDAFERELIKRSPLAACVLDMSNFIFDEQHLKSIWDAHRGRCYEDVLNFRAMLRLMRDALMRHGGSAHKLFLELESREEEPVDESNFYRKLARTPVQISRAMLSHCTQRLSELLPGPVVKLPGCFDGFEVIIGDGKKIKNAAKRLKPTRGYRGKMLGANALVALDVRRSLAIALSDSLDGMSNDVPLVPLLMPQLHALIDRPILSIWDRQFDDVRTLRCLSQREGDAFLVRMKQTQAIFEAESSVKTRDAQGRRVLDEIGMLGQGKQQMRVRRITLFRNHDEDEEDVVLLTNLLDRDLYKAQELLDLYRRRWGIEQVFQQVTETFSLRHLIGSSPKATLLQFSFCLLLYNLMQVVKVYVAEDGRVLASVISMFYLFDDTRKQMQAWAYLTDGSWSAHQRDAAAMRDRLRTLLCGSWDPIRHRKASDKKPRGKPKPKQRLHGGYSSVQRALEGRVRVVAS